MLAPGGSGHGREVLLRLVSGEAALPRGRPGHGDDAVVSCVRAAGAVCSVAGTTRLGDYVAADVALCAVIELVSAVWCSRCISNQFRLSFASSWSSGGRACRHRRCVSVSSSGSCRCRVLVVVVSVVVDASFDGVVSVSSSCRWRRLSLSPSSRLAGPCGVSFSTVMTSLRRVSPGWESKLCGHLGNQSRTRRGEPVRCSLV